MSSVFLRQVPGPSVVHRLWAGTKIIGAVAISLLLMVLPTWPVLAMIAVFLLATAVLARIPFGAVPRLPWWFWATMVAGGVINAVAGSVGIVQYLRVTVFALLMLFSAMVVAWTTPMNEIAPALAQLGSPLRKLHLPVDEWAVAVALCLRSLPLMIEDLRILRAARKLRPRNPAAYAQRRESPIIDITTATMAVALRRAAELGEAITARGGTGRLAAYPIRPGRPDVIAWVVIAAISGASIWLGVIS